MKEHPILFSAPMIRAILAGTKTQTRRIVKPQPIAPDVQQYHCPYGQTGDRLWVKEGFHHCPHCDDGFVAYLAGGFKSGDAAIDDDNRPLMPKCAAHKWRPPIYMPRWASRITLEITDVRVERLQDISEADAEAEGTKNSLHLQGGRMANENFAHLWWGIYGDGSWDANPWVWAISFRRVDPAVKESLTTQIGGAL